MKRRHLAVKNLSYVVSSYQVRLVVLFSASFADGALVTPPALLKDHLGHPHVDAVGMVALTTLGGENNKILFTNTLVLVHLFLDLGAMAWVRRQLEVL